MTAQEKALLLYISADDLSIHQYQNQDEDKRKFYVPKEFVHGSSIFLKKQYYQPPLSMKIDTLDT